MGSPPVRHKGVFSNTDVFVLSPRITLAEFDLVSSSVHLNVTPVINQKQRVLLLLNEITGGNGNSYSFPVTLAPLSPPGTNDITIPITNVQAGTYLVRIQVDGAESPLNSNADGEYDFPTMIIP